MEISRNPAFLKDLYTTELYSIDENKSDSASNDPVEQESAAPTLHAGDGSSGVALVLPNEPGEQELELLVKILESIQIPLDSALQITKISDTVDQLLEDHHIHTIISFGVPCDYSKATLLQTQPLTILQSDIQAKKDLWAAIKAHF